MRCWLLRSKRRCAKLRYIDIRISETTYKTVTKTV
jgi:hypothetical protein